MTDISDHYPLFHVNKDIVEKDTDIFFWKRIYNDTNKQSFLRAISEVDWGEINSSVSTQEAFTCFHDSLKSLLDKIFSKIRVKKKYNTRKPWLTEKHRNSIKHKNKLYAISIKRKTAYNEMCYTACRNKLNHVLRAAEKK